MLEIKHFGSVKWGSFSSYFRVWKQTPKKRYL